MQIATLNGNSATAGGNASAVDEAVKPADAASATQAQSAAASNSASNRPAASAPLQRGVAGWDDNLQGEISSAQQAMDFLDQSASQLQALKSEVAAKLAAHAGREGQAEARVRQFAKTWNARQAASGGSLDAQLHYSSPAPASQSFTVRGLNLASLQSGAKELLTFSVASASQSLSSVSIAPGMSAGEITNRLDQALAPAQIRVAQGADGALVFSAPEAIWPQVRDTLAVRGNGVRFPTGQMSRVKTETEAPVILPEGWGTDDTEALRQTLQNVIQALARIQQARATVSQALASTSQRVAAAQPVNLGAGMDQLAADFSTSASGSGYQALLSISSALVGISRERVVSLLSL